MVSNWHLVLIEGDKFHLRYIQNNLEDNSFLSFMLNHLSSNQEVQALFGAKCDMRFLYNSASQMEGQKINDNVFYKKMNTSNVILTEEEFSKKEEGSKRFCIYQNNKWYVLNYILNKNYEILWLDFNNDWTSRIIPLQYLMNVKNFAGKNLNAEKIMKRPENWANLKKMYYENFIKDDSDLKQKYIWWNKFILNTSSVDEPPIFEKLKIEIEKDKLENSVIFETKNHVKLKAKI